MVRHNPSSEPKFHIADKVDGDGKVTRAPLRIDKSGCVLRIDFIRWLVRIN